MNIDKIHLYKMVLSYFGKGDKVALKLLFFCKNILSVNKAERTLV
jgi:hypothetical protein